MIGRYRSGFKTTSRGCLAPTALDAIQFYPSIHDPGAVFNEELTPIALGLVAKLGFLTFVVDFRSIDADIPHPLPGIQHNGVAVTHPSHRMPGLGGRYFSSCNEEYKNQDRQDGN